jgi:UDP-N-acetylmuramoylalanine--D-glutamate ligase
MQIAGRRVTLMGLGHFGGGIAAARWLAAGGARVTVTDTAPASALADALTSLAGAAIAAYHLGGHREDDFRQADLVVVNPAVRPDNRFLQIAASSGVPTTSEIELFLDACPAKVVGVTGSNGKSTTAAMTAAIFQAAGRRTWLGGNIGVSLLEHLAAIGPWTAAPSCDTIGPWAAAPSCDTIGPADAVVLELSSFQLWHLSPRARPVDVAVVTNCTPNHLDWHGTWADYVAAKQRILSQQGPEGLAVLNRSDPEVDTWACGVRGRLVPPAADGEIPPLAVPGQHNRVNARCAAAAAMATGCSCEAVRAGLAAYQPLSQRLELLGDFTGRRVYNDSSATTPESTIAALQAIEGPLWLLAGGADKGSDFRPLARQIARRASGAAFFGKVRRLLCDDLLHDDPRFPCTEVETMADALAWCWDRSRAGDAILFSPACSSHDQFPNFRRRGEQFAEQVKRMKDEG